MPRRKAKPSTSETTLDLRKLILTIISILTLFSLLFSGFVYLDTKHAQADDHKDLKQKHVRLAQRVDLGELEHRYRAERQEMYFLMGELRKYPNNQEIKRRLEEVQEEVKDLKDKIKELRNKQ